MRLGKLECVVVCVDYSDYLAWTLPINKQFFDKMVVVTTTTDKLTQKMCEFWHVQCVQSDACYGGGDPFNKGAAINEGIKALDGDGWVLHMDADILLPAKFRTILESIELDDEGIYGCDRLMCEDFTEWLKFWTKPTVQIENDIYVHNKPFAVGVRISSTQPVFGGWIPIGFFQMWNQNRMNLTYPTEHRDAGRSDLLFAQQFDRTHRHNLSEIFCIHLEQKDAESKMSINWAGRASRTYGAAIVGDFITRRRLSGVSGGYVWPVIHKSLVKKMLGLCQRVGRWMISPIVFVCRLAGRLKRHLMGGR